MKKRVLFICSGNYYRSRYAEIYFNYLAQHRNILWEALSCGTEVFKYQNIGPISADTIRALEDIEVMQCDLNRFPSQIDEQILETADLIIALKKAEHQAPLVRDFPHYEKKVIYWHVHDLDAATCEQAFAEIKILVENLLDSVQNPDV